MRARSRVGAAAIDNPWGNGRTQLFAEERSVLTEAEAERVHAGHGSSPQDTIPAPGSDWSQAQREVYHELLEVLPPEEAWQAAADLLEHPSDRVVADRPTDWTFAITAVAVGVGLFHFARKTKTRRRR